MQQRMLSLLTLPLLFFGSTTIQSNICEEKPTTPVITAPAANSMLSSQTTVMSGTTTAGSTVAITENGQPVASVMSDVNGGFAVQVTLAVGQNLLTAQASNPCGISGAAPETVTVVLPVVIPPISSGGGSSSSGSTGSGTTTGSGGSQSTGTTPTLSATTPSPGAIVRPVAPTIRVTTPANHSTTSRASIFVGGTTSIQGIEVITVNGVKVATLYSTTDSFGANIPLQLGHNSIQVTITANGQTATAQITVTLIRYVPFATPWYDMLWGRLVIALVVLLIMASSVTLFMRRRRRQQEQQP